MRIVLVHKSVNSVRVVYGLVYEPQMSIMLSPWGSHDGSLKSFTPHSSRLVISIMEKVLNDPMTGSGSLSSLYKT